MPRPPKREHTVPTEEWDGDYAEDHRMTLEHAIAYAVRVD